VEAETRTGQTDLGLVLVVDDDELMLDAVSYLLEERGFRVKACTSALQGLAALRRGLAPDLIVLDLMMPEMDGWEFRVSQKAHPVWSEIPVLALTGDISPKAAAIDADAILNKPLNHRLLTQTVEQLMTLALRRKRSEHEHDLNSLRDMGSVASVIAEQLAPSLSALVENVRLAERKMRALERRLPPGDASRLAGIRLQLQAAERAGERIAGSLQGVSIFSQIALHALQGKRRVLIAHHEARLCAILRESLQDDHELLTVYSGADALKALRDDNFDVFLCELRLPDLHSIDIHERLMLDRPEQARRMVFMLGGEVGDRERDFFTQHRAWQLQAPFRASDIRELIDTQWLTFH
jgi:CheY-like chemotaxis protein